MGSLGVKGHKELKNDLTQHPMTGLYFAATGTIFAVYLSKSCLPMVTSDYPNDELLV